MKLFLIILSFLTKTTCTEPITVYICNSSGAKKYHLKENCKGLSTCQHKILKMTLEKAKADGKTLCGWED